jgi:hypothetical protein
MNPGKIVDAQTIEHNLRYGVSYKDETVNGTFHYRNENSSGIGPYVYGCG